MAKSKNNNTKNIQQIWKSFATKNNYSNFHWDEYQKPEPIESIVDGWKFTIFKSKQTIRLEAISDTTSCGIGVKVSAYMHTHFDNHVYNWAYKIIATDNTVEPSGEEGITRSQSEQEVYFDVAIKSMDDSYQKWFDVWSINQSGVSFKFNSHKHSEIMKKILSLGELMEKMKVRILLEKLS
jgi:hypothetical protein